MADIISKGAETIKDVNTLRLMTGARLDAGSESYSLSDSRTFRLVRPTHCCLVKLSNPVARDPRSGRKQASKERGTELPPGVGGRGTHTPYREIHLF